MPNIRKSERECVMRVDQTPLENAIGVGQLQTYAGPLAGGEFGVGLANMDTIKTRNVTVAWEALGVPKGTKMKVRDVWHKKGLNGFHVGSFTAEVDPHDTALFRLSPLR